MNLPLTAVATVVTAGFLAVIFAPLEWLDRVLLSRTMDRIMVGGLAVLSIGLVAMLWIAALS